MKEGQHTSQFLFLTAPEATARSKLIGILESSKNTVPPSDISIIEMMNSVLVVNRVVLRPLKEQANPRGRSQVTVIKELSPGREHVEPASRFD